jgi:outer membrane receptor protein involved in Fe transport
LFELYFETSERTVFGNVDLDPETGDMVEAEYAGAIGGVALRVAAYRTWYDQEIFRARLNPGVPTDTALFYVNGDPFTASGLAIEARHDDMFMAYTYTRGGDDEGADSPAAAFRFVPDHSLNAGGSRTFGPLRASGVVRYRSAVSGPSGAPQEIDAQARVDLSLTYRRRHGAFALAHIVALDNATGSHQLVPEYVRQNINHVPGGFGRSLTYRLRLSR